VSGVALEQGRDSAAGALLDLWSGWLMDWTVQREHWRREIAAADESEICSMRPHRGLKIANEARVVAARNAWHHAMEVLGITEEETN
jgi:hypothetical protein